MRKGIRLMIIFAGSCALCRAQDRLGLQDAIARALDHNFDIRIYKTQAEEAAANNTAGNAGMLPNIYGTGAISGGSTSTHIELANGDVQDRNNARASTVSGGVNLNWILFDGGRMFVSKRQLNAQERLGELNFKEQVQQTVAQTIQAYALIVYQQQQTVAIDTALALAKVRMDLSYAKYETGISAKTDFLQARVDYNARQSDSLNQIAQLNNSYGSLNVLMGTDAAQAWIVDDSLSADLSLQPKDRQRLEEINFGLAAYKTNADVYRLEARKQFGAMLPTLSLNGAYNYTRSKSETGYAFLNQNIGPSASLNLNVPIFMGGNLHRQYKVASLEAFNNELQYEKQRTDFGRQYRTAWSNYHVSVSAYNLEKENIKYARENLDIQKARFRVGIATTLEERQAENDYITALVRLYTAAYNLKVNETMVLLLENGLVK